MNTAKAIDRRFAKLWPQRGTTRGFPLWERQIAQIAIDELTSAGEPSLLVEWIRKVTTDDKYGHYDEIKFLIPTGVQTTIAASKKLAQIVGPYVELVCSTCRGQGKVEGSIVGCKLTCNRCDGVGRIRAFQNNFDI